MSRRGPIHIAPPGMWVETLCGELLCLTGWRFVFEGGHEHIVTCSACLNAAALRRGDPGAQLGLFAGGATC